MKNENPKYYPLDFDSLTKGELITEKELKEILGKTPNTDEYTFALMALQSAIHEKTGFTAKISNKTELRILTDSEASVYNNNLQRRHLNAFTMRHYLNMQVDVALLTDEERKKHDNNIIRNGRILQAIQKAKKGFLNTDKEMKQIEEKIKED